MEKLTKLMPEIKERFSSYKIDDLGYEIVFSLRDEVCVVFTGNLIEMFNIGERDMILDLIDEELDGAFN